MTTPSCIIKYDNSKLDAIGHLTDGQIDYLFRRFKIYITSTNISNIEVDSNVTNVGLINGYELSSDKTRVPGVFVVSKSANEDDINMLLIERGFKERIEGELDRYKVIINDGYPRFILN